MKTSFQAKKKNGKFNPKMKNARATGNDLPKKQQE
jgi:hypothetical protein